MRNYGIDLLRLVSMYMVVIIHVLSYGGIVESTSGMSHYVALLIETIVYCAVNCFAIITGYVFYNENKSDIKYSKYLKIWVQVVFYGVLISGIFLLIFRTTSISRLVYSFVPVLSNRYWYFTAYTVVFFLSPFLNIMIRKSSSKELNILVAVIISLFSIYYSVAFNFGGDIFYLTQGFSAFWLLMMYIIGAWIKKVNIAERINNKWLFLVMASVLVTWLAKSVMPKTICDIIGAYTSPTIVFNSIIIVALFSKIRMGYKSTKVIKFLSPAAFGVYLIHNNILIREIFMIDSFIWVSSLNPLLFSFVILLIGICIFAVCLLIEKFRLFLFRLCKVDKLINNISNYIDSSVRRYLCLYNDD